MLDAAKEILSFADGKTRRDLNKDRMLVLSIIKNVEIIGEAASKVTEETRGKCSDISWLDIIGMRNHLIHVYFDIDLDIVWDTVKDDIPNLIKQIEPLIPPNK